MSVRNESQVRTPFVTRSRMKNCTYIRGTCIYVLRLTTAFLLYVVIVNTFTFYVETCLSYRLPTVLCIRELSFNKGDIISVIKLVDPNWYEAELNGKIGLVPSSYVEVLDTAKYNRALVPSRGKNVQLQFTTACLEAIESVLIIRFHTVWLPYAISNDYGTFCVHCRVFTARQHSICRARSTSYSKSVCLSVRLVVYLLLSRQLRAATRRQMQFLV